MPRILCLSFERADAADKALNALLVLPEVGRAELVDACAVRRDPAGNVRLKQAVDLMTGGMTGGGLLGTACGWLVGSLLIEPSVGMLVGAAAGAAIGAICGALSDYGIDDCFIAEAAGSVAPGGSALFVLLRHANVEPLLAQLAAHRPILLHTSLKPSADRRKDADDSATARFDDTAWPGRTRRDGYRIGARMAPKAGRPAHAHACRRGIRRLHDHHVRAVPGQP